MTPAAFIAWLAAVKAAGHATSDAGAGKLLGIDPDTVVKIKRRGADWRTALACAAVLAGIAPYMSNG